MLFKTLSAAVYGIDANLIDVEVDVSGVKMNEDHFTTVGLPDTAVRESRERIRAALKNCGYDIPPTHITINLAPADLKKEGSGFDLPMALGILGAYGGLKKQELGEFVIVGRTLARRQPASGARRAADCRGRTGAQDSEPAGAGAERARGRRGRGRQGLSR